MGSESQKEQHMKIVVGFVDTAEGHAAIDKAIEEAKLRDASLVVLNSKPGGRHEEAEDYIAMSRALAATEATLKESGVTYDIHEYVRGNKPSKDIVDAVADHEADLIVIGIRTRSATGKMLLGSNALDILHDATVPVLCVKAE